MLTEVKTCIAKLKTFKKRLRDQQKDERATEKSLLWILKDSGKRSLDPDEKASGKKRSLDPDEKALEKLLVRRQYRAFLLLLQNYQREPELELSH